MRKEREGKKLDERRKGERKGIVVWGKNFAHTNPFRACGGVRVHDKTAFSNVVGLK